MPTSVQSSSYSSDGQLQPQSSTREYPSIPNEADYALPAFEDDDLNGGHPIADYTEGAGEAEIREAIVIRGARKRADSMSGWQGEDDDHQTSIFAGPGAQAIPSSVTSMHSHFPQSRHSFSIDSHRRSMSRSRRPSGESRRPRLRSRNAGESSWSHRSGDEADHSTDELDPEDDDHRHHERGGLLEGIASAFGFGGVAAGGDEEDGRSHRGRRSFSSARSRPSIFRQHSSRSQAVSSREGSPVPSSDENWGYSSNDEGTNSDASNASSRRSFRSENNDLVPPSSRPHSPTLVPLLPSDPVFSSIDVEGHAKRSAEDAPAFPFAGVQESSSVQIITLPDEDLSILFRGYATIVWKELFWWMGCIASAGILGLIGRWVPSIWVNWVGKQLDFVVDEKTRWVLVETPYHDLNIVPLSKVPYPYPVSTVFPAYSTSQAATPGPGTPRSDATSVPLSTAKDMLPVDLERGRMGWEETMGFLKYVEYRYTRFALDERTGKFQMVRDWRDPLWTSLRAVASGLDESTREQRRLLFGLNSIDIEGKSVLTLLLDEVLHPFYVFQVASIILWSLDDYYYYAFAIALISVSSILQTLIETKRTIERMREMSRFVCPVQALIDGEWQTVDSTTLVPGDIFDAADGSLPLFPCDAVLLSGDAIVNESMLTGESVPVSKVPVSGASLLALSREAKQGSTDVSPDLAKHFLFSGTKIIRVRPVNGGGGSINPSGTGGAADRAPALVVRTGFNTTKGALVRSMLFPKPMGFKFYRDSMHFIGVLALIAGLGFLVSVGKFVEIGIKWHTILVRALDLITVVVPPALPATLSIGTTFAIDRLRKIGIFCISPTRVNIGGKINVVCFDKTGTLTEEGLEVLGVRSVDKLTGRFSELHANVADVPQLGGPDGKTPLLYALATCHSLKTVDGKVIGDPLDEEMFNFTEWILEEGRAGTAKPSAAPSKQAERPQTLVQTVVRPPSSSAFRFEDAIKAGSKHAHFLELGVIRTFDFVSSLRRMSVIVKRLKSPSMEVYVKGAPEVMADICDPTSFPKDYDDLLSYYTKHGFRVIAIAGKSVPGLTWLKAQRMKREAVESNLQFLGLIVFENKLKPGTTPAISVLRGAHLACRMVTGDNVRTAVSVARECGLVTQSATVFLPTFASGGPQQPDARVEWTSVDDEDFKLDEETLRPILPAQTQLVEQDDDEPFEYNLAVTGDVFRWMVDWAPLETFQRMLIKGVIFARMSPDEKHELVERLQGLGYTVCFCGDGANDCGALKAADVGISLSEAEASVAAPFTSRTPDISCVIEVIKEGRAALVTSFSCFKYMALYSLIQFTTITLLYSFASSLGDFQFLYIDLFIIIPIAVAMGRTLPYPDIHPKRPTGSLVSKRVLTSIISQTLINGLIQFAVFVLVRRQPWYEEPEVNVDKLETLNFENTALFLVSSFQYILVAAVFSVGPPYRKPVWTNYSLLACFVALAGFSTYILWAPTVALQLILDLMSIDASFKLQLTAIVILNIVLCFASERWAEGAIVNAYSKARSWLRRRSRGARHVKGPAYKRIT